MKFNEVQVLDEPKDKVEVIKEIIKKNDQEDAFYILDLGDIINKHRTWCAKFPRVDPYFAMKCNPDPTVVKTLAGLNAGFDCASKYEIELALVSGVPSDRIIFANTVKQHSHIEYAKRVGVNLLTADSKFELEKIKSIFPEAKIVIRFRCDSATAQVNLGSKCGCDPVSVAPKLIRMAKDMGLDVRGFSFHVGTLSTDTTAWITGIKIGASLIEYAKSIGLENVNLLDIGGGFPGESGHPIDKFAEAIHEALEEVDPSIRVISEPGRYYVASAFTLASLVYGKRIVEEKNGRRYMYYVNDGTYGSFIEAMLDLNTRIPRPLNKPEREELHPTTFWGPTCDSYDCVVRDCNYPELKIGDWLVWSDMGAYTLSLAGTFNGIFPSVVFPFITQNEWNSFLKERVSKTNGVRCVQNGKQNGVQNGKQNGVLNGKQNCVLNGKQNGMQNVKQTGV